MACSVFQRSHSDVEFRGGLYENDPNKRFDIIFGTIQPGSDQLYVSGVQGPNNVFTQDFCFAGPPSAGSIPEQSTLMRFQRVSALPHIIQ
jgi:hypothetical protein